MRIKRSSSPVCVQAYVASSGRPFDILTGRYQGADIPFTQRPTLAGDAAGLGVIATRFGFFNLNPLPDQRMIPRNFGQGPGFQSASLRLSKEIPFGGVISRKETGSGGKWKR